MNPYYDNPSTSSDPYLCLPSPPHGGANFSTANYHPPSSIKALPNPRKKRTKMLRINDARPISKPKKPDPSAPKITRPCSECGKRFWSWKALFGHMRCHPERQWRGINPPPNLKKSDCGTSYGDDFVVRMTDDDYHVATCLLMLANGPISVRDQPPTVISTAVPNVGILSDSELGFRDVGGFLGFGDYDGSGGSNCRFECSSCKKVFGSHQALGGHRASHKNVKGCFAITRTEGEEDVAQEVVEGDHERKNIVGEGTSMDPSNNSGNGTSSVLTNLGIHQCSICFRVFSSGQALGGHKRCHWEKLGDDPVNIGGSSSVITQGLNHGSFGLTACGLDLSMVAAPVDHEARSSVSYTSDLTLDLRLGL